jgi:hypothetical protein
VAIISDARLAGRTDQHAIAERLLSISGEDTITVYRKFRDAWTGLLQTRFLILSNELPRLADASGALAGRFIMLVLIHSFYGHEDHGLTDGLLTELPGILNWSIAGWQRLSERRHFVQPNSALDPVRQLEDLGSPIGAFIREECEVGPGYSVETHRLFQPGLASAVKLAANIPAPLRLSDATCALPCRGLKRPSLGKAMVPTLLPGLATEMNRSLAWHAVARVPTHYRAPEYVCVRPGRST